MNKITDNEIRSIETDEELYNEFAGTNNTFIESSWMNFQRYIDWLEKKFIELRDATEAEEYSCSKGYKYCIHPAIVNDNLDCSVENCPKINKDRKNK